MLLNMICSFKTFENTLIVSKYIFLTDLVYLSLKSDDVSEEKQEQFRKGKYVSAS